MAWVRLHDGALTHPKVLGIFDPRRPLDLWVWGLSYTQTHLTDGWLPAQALPRGCGKAAAVLVVQRLWQARDDGGYDIHDYLDWNDSRESVTKKRTEAKERMSGAREKRSRESVPQRSSLENNSHRTADTAVPRGVSGLKSISPEKKKEDDSVEMRGGRLVERYGELYQQHRHGARHRSRPTLDWQEACELCRLWDDARLEKLAVLVLTTDDVWISGTDRNFKIFATKASWADDKLRQWETEHGIAVTA